MYERNATAPDTVRASVKRSARQNRLVCQPQMIFNLDGVKTVTGARCSGHGMLMRFAPQIPVSLGKLGHGGRRGHGVKEMGCLGACSRLDSPPGLTFVDKPSSGLAVHPF